MNDNKIKISIAVISYNSSNTIIETLDSILSQDYGTDNIELVISDDGSSDETPNKVNNWLKEYNSFFFNVKVFYNSENQGVPKNCNIAWKACEQSWIKTIAADDILLPNCISSFVRFTQRNPDAKAIFSYMQWFGNRDCITPKDNQLNFFALTANKQFEYLKYLSFNIAPSSFMHNPTLKSVGYADEKYTLFEDLPLWLKLTSKNIKLYFNSEVTVMYRIGNSISKNDIKFINIEFVHNCISLNQDYKIESFPSIKWFLKKEELFLYRSQIFLTKVFGNKKYPNYYIYRFLWLFVPFTVFFKFNNKLAIIKE